MMSHLMKHAGTTAAQKMDEKRSEQIRSSSEKRKLEHKDERSTLTKQSKSLQRGSREMDHTSYDLDRVNEPITVPRGFHYYSSLSKKVVFIATLKDSARREFLPSLMGPSTPEDLERVQLYLHNPSQHVNIQEALVPDYCGIQTLYKNGYSPDGEGIAPGYSFKQPSACEANNADCFRALRERESIIANLVILAGPCSEGILKIWESASKRYIGRNSQDILRTALHQSALALPQETCHIARYISRTSQEREEILSSKWTFKAEYQVLSNKYENLKKLQDTEKMNYGRQNFSNLNKQLADLQKIHNSTLCILESTNRRETALINTMAELEVSGNKIFQEKNDEIQRLNEELLTSKIIEVQLHTDIPDQNTTTKALENQISVLTASASIATCQNLTLATEVRELSAKYSFASKMTEEWKDRYTVLDISKKKLDVLYQQLQATQDNLLDEPDIEEVFSWSTVPLEPLKVQAPPQQTPQPTPNHSYSSITKTTRTTTPKPSAGTVTPTTTSKK